MFFFHIVDFDGDQLGPNCIVSVQPRNKGRVVSSTKKLCIYFLTTNAHLALACPHALHNNVGKVSCDQSRSSPHAECTSCIRPPKHQGPPCSQIIFVSFLNLASGYENMNDHLF